MWVLGISGLSTLVFWNVIMSSIWHMIAFIIAIIMFYCICLCLKCENLVKLREIKQLQDHLEEWESLGVRPEQMGRFNLEK